MIDAEPTVESSSWVSSQHLYDNPKRSPIAALTEIFKPEDNIDWLICPGDLADKHNPTCQGVAWKRLIQLRDELHIRHFFGTVGNHDVDSRHVNERRDLPTTHIKSLPPSFPHANATNDSIRTSFWSDGVAQFVEPDKDISLVILNSSQYHGLDSGDIVDGELTKQEWERGKIAPETISKFEEIVKSTSTNRNICLLHHHLHTSPDLTEDMSVLVNANELLSILGKSAAGWLTVHGHLHVPRVYHEYNEKLLTILSAGSIGGKTWPSKRGITPDHQVHLIEIDESKNLKAQIFSWTWTTNDSWKPAVTFTHGLPSRSGFGATKSVEDLIQLISQHTNEHAECKWSDLEKMFVDINFLIPNQMNELFSGLENNGLELFFDRSTGLPKLVKGAPDV